MKKLLTALILAAIVLVGVTTAANDASIIVYSCMEKFRNDALQEQLNEEFPDLDVFVMYMPTSKAAAKLSIEGPGSDADIIVALEDAYMSKVEHHMAEVSQYSHLEYLDELSHKGGRYIVWERPTCSVIVNQTVLDKYDLPLPRTYQDLLNPMYKDLVVMPDPKSSSTGFSFLLNLINVWGEEEAFAYFDKLAGNVKQFSESGLGPIKLLIQGEAAIGLGLTAQAVDEINKGNEFLILEPEFGAPYSLTATSMLEGRQNDPNIVRVFEFIANDYMVYDKTYGTPGKVLKDQVNGIPNYPQDMNFADMTGIDDLQEKERILAKWKY